jgi:magnesium-transporting ATPase (P-type)
MQAIEKGRVIYSGIQKFICFIMSVHFSEVLQIFLCIVSSIPVMRQPLQILFLILVTDLPPSIALGFEPGEELIMKRKPRPRTQPVVMMWMWRGIVANGLILTVCIFCIYMLALWAYAGAFDTEEIISPTRESCTIWRYQDWSPTLDFKCSLQPPDVARWKPCANSEHIEKKDTPNKGTDWILQYMYIFLFSCAHVLGCMHACMYSRTSAFAHIRTPTTNHSQTQTIYVCIRIHFSLLPGEGFKHDRL